MFSVRVEVDADAAKLAEESAESTVKDGASTSPGKKQEEDSTTREVAEESNEETVSFFSGNPRVEVSRGTIKLYRHRDHVSADGIGPGSPTRVSATHSGSSSAAGSSTDLPSTSSTQPSSSPSSSSLPKEAVWGRNRSLSAKQHPESEMVCIIAVPGSMSGPDFCKFVAPHRDTIEHMRILRQNDSYQYMVTIKLKDVAKARQFKQDYHGRRFNSLESEICHVVYVKQIVMEDDTATTTTASGGAGVELPTCPVCLERLDSSVSGILTIQCNHTFHCSCLSKWGDIKCPVCRYVQDPPSETSCDVCGSTDSPWICVLCGFVGCGRYIDGHAYEHFKETGHAYSMEIESKRVWDYVGDNYVHRLVHNKQDGKVVELPGPPGVSTGGKHENDDIEVAKLSSITMQYDYLLTSQLEAQREYYETEITQLRADMKTAVIDADEANFTLVADNQTLDAKLRASEKALKASEKGKEGVRKELGACREELDFLKQMNESLTSNQQGWEDKFNRLKAEGDAKAEAQAKQIADLEEQVRDLMFFVEGRQKIANSGEEVAADIAGGYMIVPDAPANNSPKNRKGKKGKSRAR